MFRANFYKQLILNYFKNTIATKFLFKTNHNIIHTYKPTIAAYTNITKIEDFNSPDTVKNFISKI